MNIIGSQCNASNPLPESIKCQQGGNKTLKKEEHVRDTVVNARRNYNELKHTLRGMQTIPSVQRISPVTLRMTTRMWQSHLHAADRALQDARHDLCDVTDALYLHDQNGEIGVTKSDSSVIFNVNSPCACDLCVEAKELQQELKGVLPYLFLQVLKLQSIESVLLGLSEEADNFESCGEYMECSEKLT